LVGLDKKRSTGLRLRIIPLFFLSCEVKKKADLTSEVGSDLFAWSDQTCFRGAVGDLQAPTVKYCPVFLREIEKGVDTGEHYRLERYEDVLSDSIDIRNKRQ